MQLTIDDIIKAVEKLNKNKLEIIPKAMLNTTNTALIIGNKVYHPKDLQGAEIKIIELPEIDLESEIKFPATRADFIPPVMELRNNF